MFPNSSLRRNSFNVSGDQEQHHKNLAPVSGCSKKWRSASARLRGSRKEEGPKMRENAVLSFLKGSIQEVLLPILPNSKYLERLQMYCSSSKSR